PWLVAFSGVSCGAAPARRTVSFAGDADQSARPSSNAVSPADSTRENFTVLEPVLRTRIFIRVSDLRKKTGGAAPNRYLSQRRRGVAAPSAEGASRPMDSRQ